MAHKPASSALSDLTVIDLTRARSGPTAVRQLADWGADVIKIEIPEALEPGDVMGGSRHGSDFQNLQRNKRSLTLNIKEPDGLAVLKKLVATADVVVENFRPDVKDRLGVDYESLAAVNPRIILASISGFGQDGPYAKRPGFDQIAQGMGGLMSITGEPGKGPMRVGIPIADLTAGIFAAQAILVALLEREASGKGQWVQTSLLQAQIFMLDFQAARWLVDGEVPKQAGNNHPTSIPTGVFATADGYMNIAVAGQEIWLRFCKCIDRMDLAENPDYADGKTRSANRDALNATIEEVTRTQSTATWVERFNAAGVPSGEIHTIDQVFSNPQVEHLGIAQEVTSHERGATRLVGQPIHMSRTPSRIAAPPPTAGEHNEEVLRGIGYSDDDIARLRTAGVI